MGRPPTRQLTLRFVLRTLERLRMVTRLDDKNLAEELKAAGWRLNDVAFLGQYLLNVVELNGGLNHDHPNGNCPQCGHDIGRDHNGARYCSNRCRQRAYRLRLNRQGQIKRNKLAICDTSKRVEEETSVTHTGAA